MTKEISDFIKAHRAKNFPESVKAPKDEKKSGDLGGYNLGSRDPESDKLAANHVRTIHGSHEGQKDPKDGVKDSLDDPKNKRLKGRGRNEKGDPMYEANKISEVELDEKNWIQNAIKHPGALTRKAHKHKESPMEYAHEHEHSGGKTGKQSRLALTLKNLHRESVVESTKDPIDVTGHPQPELDKSIKPKGKKLLLGDKLKEDTLANQVAIAYLNKRLTNRMSESIISGEHDVGCNPPNYTAGMEINKTPDGETQTSGKPLTSKNEKSKKITPKSNEKKI